MYPSAAGPGFVPAAESPSSAQPVASCDEAPDWVIPKPPSEFWAPRT